MRRKALIVEDEIELGQLLGEHLRAWGFEPHILNEGKDAVQWARQNQPDVILLDLLLPDTDGYSLCEAIKLDRETNLIPIVMITALSGQSDRIRGLEVGANQYLCKPFAAAELQRAILTAQRRIDDLKRNGAVGEINFRLRSDTHYLDELNQMLGSLFLFSGFTQPQAKQLMTAVRELGCNAIEWGHKKQVDRIVHLDYRIDPEKVIIVIRDSGPGFNPANLPHAAGAEDPIAHMEVREALGLREGGFGILMSRGLVDELSYNKAGNEVTLVKYFPSRDHLKPDAERGGEPALK
jgi:two-component system OmpR family response regulator